MADTDLAGLEVQELDADDHDDEVVIRAGWPDQLRRKGSSSELPGPQSYLDLPSWLSGPAKRAAPEEDALPEDALQ
jgi:hypothetical protein